MDPFSLTVGALGCASAAATISDRGIKLIQRLRHAPGVVNDIINEVDNFKMVVAGFRNAQFHINDSTYISQEDRSRMFTIFDTAKKKLLELEEILEHEMIKLRKESGHIHISRFSTARRADDVAKLRQEFKDLISYVQSLWQAISFPSQLTMQNDVRDIAAGVTFLVEAQRASIVAASSLLNTQSSSPLPWEGQPVYPGQAEPTTVAQQAVHSGAMTVRAVVPDGRLQSQRSDQWASSNTTTVSPIASDSLKSLYKGSCRAWCSCRCHRQIRGHAMAGNISVVGFLFICLSGGRYNFQTCNEPRCQRKQGLTFRLDYVFPAWLLARAVYLIFTFSQLSGPKFTPRWSGTFSGDAKIFMLTIDGDLDGIKKLFADKEASPHDVAISTGRTALHYAIVYNHNHICEFLLQQNADSKAVDKFKESAIHIAWTRIFGKLADESTTEAFSTMFSDEEYLDSRQFPPFHKIILGLSGANLAQQLDLTADRIDARDADGRTALSWAAARGDDDAVSQLLRAKADPNITGHDRRTPLHWAAQSGNSQTLEILLKYNANINLRDQWKRTPLQYAACNHNDARYLEILIAHGADVNVQDCHDRTALGYASKHNHHDSVQCLLQNDADPTIADNWGFSPLFEAAKSTHHETLQHLVKYPVQHAEQTIQNQSLLHLVAAQGDRETVDILNVSNLRRLDYSQRDHKGYTPVDLLQMRRVKPPGLVELFESLSATPMEHT